MPTVSSQESSVARLYAAVMLDLAEAQGEADVLLGELFDFVGRVAEDADFHTFLVSPLVDVETRRNALEKLCRGGYSDLFVDALQVLSRNGRLGLIGNLAEAYRLARDDLRGRIQVHVRTASALTDELRTKLKRVASEQTGKEAVLLETVDESLIGGLVLQIGDRKFDASVATRLRRLAATLLERALQEIHSGKAHWEGAVV